ncbi:MAG: hypothetical protein ACU85V_17555 [Gammaproteobacteria bacterium]
MATIVILEHEVQRTVSRPFMVYALAERWRAAGHRVLRHHGTDAPPPADLAILNINLTVVPAAYRRLSEHYPRVVNGAAVDISKRRFSQHLLARDDDWPGPVIVKTDANFGGMPEAMLAAEARRRALPAATVPAGPVLRHYPVLDRLADVPASVWDTPGLIVEKFLPESGDGRYYMRVWSFLGSVERCSRLEAGVPVIKARDIITREAVPVPGELRRWRRELGFDFGKFDWVMHAGRPVLLDTNRTPAAPGTLMASPDFVAYLDELARGIEDFLG